jgi:hypothetical protein
MRRPWKNRRKSFFTCVEVISVFLEYDTQQYYDQKNWRIEYLVKFKYGPDYPPPPQQKNLTKYSILQFFWS